MLGILIPISQKGLVITFSTVFKLFVLFVAASILFQLLILSLTISFLSIYYYFKNKKNGGDGSGSISEIYNTNA